MATRYPMEEVRREILTVLDHLIGKGEERSGVRKRAALSIGMTEPELSKHLNAKTLRKFFNVEELGRLAAFVAIEYEVPPPGWPLVTFAQWDQLLDAALRARKPRI